MTTLTIGLTGGYCAGKNEAAAVLERKGFHVIDVDRLGHAALEREGPRIIETFGEAAVDEEGSIDRKKLGRLVFADPERLRALESILHPTMKADVRREVQSFLEKNVPVCINAALLFKMGLEELCDHVLLIRASLPVRFRRARKRDGLGIREFLHRIRSQKGLFPGPSRPSGLPRIFSGTFTSQRVVKSGAVFSKNSGKHVDIYTVWNSSDPETLRRRLEEYLILIEWQA